MSGTSWSPKVARAMREFGDAAPLPPLLEDGPGPKTRATRRRLAVSIAAGALVVAGVAGTATVLSRDTQRQPDTPSGETETTALVKPSLFDDGAALIVWVHSGATPEQVDLIRSAILQTGIVYPEGLKYFDARASLGEAQRVLADDPDGLALLNESNLSTMFQLFPADAEGFDAEQWRSAFRTLPNVVEVTAPTDLVTTSVSPDTAGSTPSLTPTTAISEGCSGDDLDVAAEPADWRQPENTAWFRNGCKVRIDVITDRPGPDHCGWDSARVLIFGDPLGATFNGNPMKQYVRDPQNAFGQGLDVGFDEGIELPPTAADTGYSTDTEQLWTVPGDDDFIYLVLNGSVERWPAGQSPLCS